LDLIEKSWWSATAMEADTAAEGMEATDTAAEGMEVVEAM
jgi:hypothetical protein